MVASHRRRLPFGVRGMKTFLIIKPSSLGDIIHGLLVAQSLREQMPGSAITWVAADQFAPMVQRCPTVDHLLVFERHGGLLGFYRLLRRIRREYYDYVLDFQGLIRSGLMTLGARAGLRIGRTDAREGASLFYQRKTPLPPAGKQSHAVEILLQFLPVLGLEPRLGAPIVLGAEPLPPPLEGLSATRPIVLAPHSREPVKEWPGFAELSCLLRRRHPETPVVWCGHKESPSPNGLASDPSFFNLTGQTTLGQMIGLIQSARLLVVNDSGPMHVAAAVGTPLVACFGPTPVERFGPYPLNKPTHRVLRAPEGDLSRLEVETVWNAVVAALG
jgi:heptosyltransferase I